MASPESEGGEPRSEIDPERSARELERLISRALRELPPDRAPAALETRVIARISGAATHRGPRARFTAWPIPARAAFVAATGACALLALAAGTWIASHLGPAQIGPLAASHLGGVSAFGGAVETFGRAVLAVYRSVPRDWLYGGFLAATGLYATLFGVLAAAYRTLIGATPREAHRP